MEDKKNKMKKSSRTGLILLLVLFLLLMVGGVAVFFYFYGGRHVDWGTYHPSTPSLEAPTEEQTDPVLPSLDPARGETSQPPETEEPLPENPVDFAALQEINPSVYAWIHVPNTQIDLPILQSELQEDDNLYLHHNIYKEYEYRGCVYTQKANGKDFTDPVTVIYGHNMLNGTMFSDLDKYYDETFFLENPYFYIYTPGHILTYEIVSAHQYDKRHLLNSFDFSQEEIFQKYLDMIQDPSTLFYHVRPDVELTTEDRIVTLSTCMNYGTARFLVQGVLISDEPTKE